MKRFISLLISVLLMISAAASAEASAELEAITKVRYVCEIVYSDYAWECDFSEKHSCIVTSVTMPDVESAFLPIVDDAVWDELTASLSDSSYELYVYIAEICADMDYVMNVLDKNGVLMLSYMNGDTLFSLR